MGRSSHLSQATFDPKVYNKSANEPFSSILAKTISRRGVMYGGFKVAAATMLGGLGLTACGSNDNGTTASDPATGDGGSTSSSVKLGFNSIPGSKTDAVAVPEGYRAQVIAPWGQPLNANAAPWKDDGTNTAQDQANSVGMHHDGMWFYPLGDAGDDGILVINHEYIDQDALHPTGPTVDEATNSRSSAEEVRKEIYAHGVSVVRISKNAQGTWAVVENDPLNRRYTGATEMRVSGPIAGSGLLVTKYSPGGDIVRGTLNNCGNGYTPWGTYLTCEENWPGYFRNCLLYTSDAAADLPRPAVVATPFLYHYTIIDTDNSTS